MEVLRLVACARERLECQVAMTEFTQPGSLFDENILGDVNAVLDCAKDDQRELEYSRRD